MLYYVPSLDVEGSDISSDFPTYRSGKNPKKH
jgi:hypothetical protein